MVRFQHISKIAGFVLVTVTSLFFMGCQTSLKVSSEPSGADLIWSPSGVDDWRPWPPATWTDKPPSSPIETPYQDRATFSNTVWITVEKDGFYRPLPQLAQLYPNRKEEFFFELQETPEAEKERLLAEGYVFYKNEWIMPQEAGLVDYNGVWMTEDQAFAMTQTDKGLVFYEGEWVSPTEREKRFAADQRAKGLVFFKDRWVSNQVMQDEETIDRTVAAIKGQNVQELRLPRVVGSLGNLDIAQIQIHNSSRFQIELLMSGPRSQKVILQPYETYGADEVERFTVLPGKYDIAVLPKLSQQEELANLDSERRTNNNIIPAITSHPFAPNFKYLITYNPEELSNEDGLREYAPTIPETPENLPTIEVPEVEIQPRRPPGGGGRPGGGGGRP